ncbi:hypothetical protein PhaeoP75_03034 [Phaeobacter gallaeciensis]|uniref:Uncharacterized protein n=1 Tax=Phaeobacter gallaeciensis TaxID=60890 RepID=A0AAC9ZCL9_9RHOB|nr:hypothetical protein Gal_02997 [Phaeobacter gallaeciensis DSM 26640]ATE93990.1 hypothetical protein PhaeoP11_02985 [Phaeobacter gallaeciensis]ATE96189.1 hypothetical protein PhaeoP73_00862 [Phaeobacter gallaeciensis]ATF02654.1 hypothetical protein PhaeoP75_03034 [Phaeobacter gallaeciensis]ATF07034.1 hypothetical protein PhaeoP63_02983 [Phaeobacter gallaeciensis]
MGLNLSPQGAPGADDAFIMHIGSNIQYLIYAHFPHGHDQGYNNGRERRYEVEIRRYIQDRLRLDDRF